MNFIYSVSRRFVKFMIKNLSDQSRTRIIKELIASENSYPPKQAAKRLLEIYDYTGIEIDNACIRWGNGVHIKHEIMNGIHSFFYERIPENSEVLDLGCGIGAVAYSVVTHVNSVVLGIDMNQRSIDFANVHFKHPRLRFQHGNVFSDIPKQETFDIIILSSVLEHLDNRSEFLQDLVHKFTPKKFLIRVPSYEQHYFKALKKELGLFAYTDPTHVLEYTTEIFKNEMSSANLKIDFLEIRWGDIWAECVPIFQGN